MYDEFAKKNNTDKKSAYIVGAILGVFSSLLAMLIFSAVLLFLNLDRAYSVPMATISLAIGSFVASFYTTKKIGEKGYIIGLIIGVVVFVIITALSLIIGKNGFTLNTLFHFIIIVLSSIVGGIIGVNGNKGKKYI